MFKHTILITIAVFAAWVPIHAPCAHAQDNVEVNLDALDDLSDYRPPPMFGAPLTGYDSGRREIKEFPLEVKTRQNSMNPQLTPHVKVEPQESGQKNIMPVSTVPLKPVEQVPVYQSALTGAQPALLFEQPPVPGRKPYLRKASLSQSVSDNAATAISPPVPKKRPDKFHASRNFIDETMTSRQPLTEDRLTQPNAAEVLASIESSAPIAEKAPAPPTAEPSPTQQTTKRPVDVEYSAKQIISFPFRPGATEMDVESRKSFEQKAMNLLKNNPDLRVQVQAYATSFGDGQSSARRLSLTRAISIRSYLIERNIDPKRIDVRALGTQTGTEPLDRVDLVFLDKNEVF